MYYLAFYFSLAFLCFCCLCSKHMSNILRTPLSKITSTGEIEQRFRLN